MNRALVFAVITIAMAACGCRREPTIELRFDAVDAALARDLGVAPASIMVDAAVVAPAPACVKDADCVLVPDGCCTCANGGKLKTALKREQAALLAAQRTACADVMCTMMASTDPTCGGRPVCVSGACVVRAPTTRP